MKKLMIAAAATAMVGAAFADICHEDVTVDPEKPQGCSFYNVKFTFKTLGLKAANCAQLGNVGQGVCTDANEIKDKEKDAWKIAYLDNATRTLDGILWQCKAACLDLTKAGDQDSKLNFVFWDKKNEVAFTRATKTLTQDQKQYAWGSESNSEIAKFDFLYRYGSAANKVAAFWRPTIAVKKDIVQGQEGYEFKYNPNDEATMQKIYAAGFGSGTFKKGVADGQIKSISGNAVAMLKPVALTKSVTTKAICADDTTAIYPYVAAVADICYQWTSWCCCNCDKQVDYVPASGTWSVKYNASASKNAQFSKLIPTFAVDDQTKQN